MINSANIILGPVVTEKSLTRQELGYYSFWVNTKANKNQIGAAFVQVFGLKPLTITTLLLKGKTKTDWKKRLPISKSDRKKAVIYVGKEHKIDLLKLNQK